MPIIILVAVLFVLMWAVSRQGSVKLPALSEERKREILDRRYEEAVRIDRTQSRAGAQALYGDLSDAQVETYLETRARMEELKKAA